MTTRLRLLAFPLGLALACDSQPVEPVGAVTPAEPRPIVIESLLLADVLGEAVEVQGDRVSADGLLVRLAFEPLIRQTGPVSLQLVQSTGYRIGGVAEGSPLWHLGLRDGDVLTSVDGQPIIGREHELRSRWERRPSSADIGYLRGAEARTLALRIRGGVSWTGSDTLSTLVTPPPRPEPSADLPGLAPTEPSPDLDVRCTPGTPPDVLAICEIDRASLDRVRADPSSMIRQARIVPRMRDGEPAGFKLYGIRPTSIPARLGLQNGDTLVAVDGQALTSLEGTLELFMQVPKTDTVTLSIERRTELVKLVIKFVDGAN